MGPPSEWSPEADVASLAPLDGRYRLDALLGRGGMGVVYQALDLRLNRPVAVKLLREGTGADETRFQAEVRTLARLTHPNLVRLLDAGDAHGRQFLVMELIEGPTLAQRIPRGPLRVPEVAVIGAGVAAALSYVHEAGIVHRDVKPANVLLDAWGSARLADFGIARLVDTSGITATGLTLGTPAYLAPEQVQGFGVGPATDVYALALVLIEGITGRRPFEGTPAEVAAARLQRAPGIPEGLDDEWRSVLESMTAVDPTERCSAAEAASHLGECARHDLDSGIAHTAAGLGAITTLVSESDSTGATERMAVPTTALEAQQTESVRRPVSGRSKRKTLAGLVGASIVGLGLVVAFGIFHLGSRGQRSPQAAGRRAPSIVTTQSRSKSAPSSSPSASTSTSTSTTTTSLAPASEALVGGELVGALENGISSGNVAPQAGQQLDYQLQLLNLATSEGSSGDQVRLFDQLAELFDQDVADGQVAGNSVATLTGSVEQLATLLGTALPPATTTTVPPIPQGVGHGHGNGNGYGNGEGHGHGKGYGD